MTAAVMVVAGRRTLASARGFTLLELTVAVALLGLVAILAHGGLVQTLRTFEHSAQSIERVMAWQRGLAIMGRDIEASVPRTIIDINGARAPAFVAGPAFFEFTRDGSFTPPGVLRSTLERVRYHYLEGALYRSHWHVLDRTSTTQVARERRVLDGLTDLTIRYLHEDGRWLTHWPRIHNALPRAIELQFAAGGAGQVRRLWQVD
ncbi:MAG: type II secretion system protein GspJ [Gammaproteobacteria bacterium]|nr:type II secretion system protein GspJ [Gammaproteobacteria bacterium]